MTKLSTRPPKQLMDPPMWVMPKPVPPSTGIIAKIEDCLYWFESLFESKSKHKPSDAKCGTSCGLKIRDDVLAQWQ